jgi:hypothetical protein
MPPQFPSNFASLVVHTLHSGHHWRHLPSTFLLCSTKYQHPNYCTSSIPTSRSSYQYRVSLYIAPPFWAQASSVESIVPTLATTPNKSLQHLSIWLIVVVCWRCCLLPFVVTWWYHRVMTKVNQQHQSWFLFCSASGSRVLVGLV